ncbi:hypothetical protein E2542_SST13412 [Spatholobus suberectus]|nr:hypothetical protein E2542_SST13412 [Spatholobus suberectus]
MRRPPYRYCISSVPSVIPPRLHREFSREDHQTSGAAAESGSPEMSFKVEMHVDYFLGFLCASLIARSEEIRNT